jgi:hypothetical protein
MSEPKDPLLKALKEGNSYTWTVPDGGDFASMRKAIKHGQTLTMSPVINPAEVQIGNFVLVKWHKGYVFHLVGDIQDGQFLIVNSLGKVNGWVCGNDILGRVTEIIDPEPRPTVPEMLEQLSETYRTLIQLDHPCADEGQRLLSIIDDLRWYAERIGPERLDTMPKQNKWSFEQNLWHLTKQAKTMVAPLPNRVSFFTDCGKMCIGSACEILFIFEYGEMDL